MPELVSEAGPRLDELLTISDVERAAREALDDGVWAYVAGGAGDERSVRANVDAFDSVWLRPRVPDTSSAASDTSVTVLGQRLSMPVLLAPTSPQRLLHEDAELATAGAAATAGTVMIASTDSHYPFAEIATAAGSGSCWFQLYSYRSRADTDAMVAMAEEAGAQALVVTVDAAHSARRISARRAGFVSPSYLDFGNLRALGILTGAVPPGARLERLVLSWEDVVRIRGRTELPLLVKGVLAAADASRCVEVGAAGVIVSNHGGRQLDSAVPSLVALEQVASRVGTECAVLVDGGVRSGVDVAKALSLGAHAVCVGRPHLWGLGIAGQEGVEAVLALLRHELEDTLRQLGVASASELGPECVAEVRWSPAGGRRGGPV